MYPRPAHPAACQTSVPKGTQLNTLLTQPVSSLQATPTRTSTQPRVRLQLNECAAGARLHTPIRLRQRHPLSLQFLWSCLLNLPGNVTPPRASPRQSSSGRRRSPGLWQHAATGFPAFSPNGFQVHKQNATLSISLLLKDKCKSPQHVNGCALPPGKVQIPQHGLITSPPQAISSCHREETAELQTSSTPSCSDRCQSTSQHTQVPSAKTS